MSWFVYLLRCRDDTLYTGVSTDPERRARDHNSGRGAAYTRSRRPVELVWQEPQPDRSAALRRELAIKALSRAAKQSLLLGRESGGLAPDRVVGAVERSRVAAGRSEGGGSERDQAARGPRRRQQGRTHMRVARVDELGAPHGFCGRIGGVSSGPFASLNLRYGSGDRDADVEENRRRFLQHFEAGPDQLCLLEQVHGDAVVPARAGGEPTTADAHYSIDPGMLLVVSTADCLPILFHDPASGAVAAAHCGWRGTVARLAARVVGTLEREFGAVAADLEVVIGPCICAGCYQVGPEFHGHLHDAGLGRALADDPREQGRYRLDLVLANRLVLAGAGVARVDVVAECTSCMENAYFSHRRDRGVTGRQWAAIRATPVAVPRAARFSGPS